jgi:hypothetical protein
MARRFKPYMEIYFNGRFAPMIADHNDFHIDVQRASERGVATVRTRGLIAAGFALQGWTGFAKASAIEVLLHGETNENI